MSVEITRLFVKVVQHGSFSRAAENLKIPKSTVSKAVSRLESETGTKLLLRTTRSLTLTAAGRAFYETCLGPIQVLEEAEKSLFGQDSILSGTVRITAPEDLGTKVIAPAIGELTRQHRSLGFELHYTDEVIDLVKDGFDFAVRIGRLSESSLKAKWIGEVFLAPMASPEYLKSAGKIRVPADLERLDCLSLSVIAKGAKWHLKTKKESATIRINSRIGSNQMTSLMQMTMAGAGVALLPVYLCANEVSSGKLVRLLPEWSTVGMPVTLLSPLPSTSSARMKIVSDKIFSEVQKALRL